MSYCFSSNTFSTLAICSLLAGLAHAESHSDDSNLGLSFEVPPEIEMPFLQPYQEYQINACAFIKHTDGVVCVPTADGGFVLVPIGGQFETADSLLDATISQGLGLAGYVVDEEDLIDIPPSLWPLIRPRESERIMGLSTRGISPGLMKNLAAEQAEVTVTLSDGGTCAADSVVTITKGDQIESRCSN